MNEDEKQDMRIGIGQQTMNLSEVMTEDAVLEATSIVQAAALTLVGIMREHGIHPDIIAGVVLGLVVGPALRGTP